MRSIVKPLGSLIKEGLELLGSQVLPHFI